MTLLPAVPLTCKHGVLNEGCDPNGKNALRRLPTGKRARWGQGLTWSSRGWLRLARCSVRRALRGLTMSWKDGRPPYMSTQRFTRARHTARQDSLHGRQPASGREATILAKTRVPPTALKSPTRVAADKLTEQRVSRTGGLVVGM